MSKSVVNKELPKAGERIYAAGFFSSGYSESAYGQGTTDVSVSTRNRPVTNMFIADFGYSNADAAQLAEMQSAWVGSGFSVDPANRAASSHNRALSKRQAELCKAVFLAALTKVIGPYGYIPEDAAITDEVIYQAVAVVHGGVNDA